MFPLVRRADVLPLAVTKRGVRVQSVSGRQPDHDPDPPLLCPGSSPGARRGKKRGPVGQHQRPRRRPGRAAEDRHLDDASRNRLRPVPRPAVDVHEDGRAAVPGPAAPLLLPALLLLRRLPAGGHAPRAGLVDERRGRENPELVRVGPPLLRLLGGRLPDAARHRAGRLRAGPRHQPLDVRLAQLPLHDDQPRRHRVPRLHDRRPLPPSRDPGRPRCRHGAHLLPHVPVHRRRQVPHRGAERGRRAGQQREDGDGDAVGLAIPRRHEHRAGDGPVRRQLDRRLHPARSSGPGGNRRRRGLPGRARQGALLHPGLPDEDRILDRRPHRCPGQQQHLQEQHEQEQRGPVHPGQPRLRSGLAHAHSPADRLDRSQLRDAHRGRRAGHGMGRQHRRRAGRVPLQDGLPDGTLRGRERQVVRGVGRRREPRESLSLAELGHLHERQPGPCQREPLLQHRDLVLGLLRRGAADVLSRFRRRPGVGAARRGPHPLLAGRAHERLVRRRSRGVHAHRLGRYRVPAAEFPALDGDRRRGRPRVAAGPHHGGLHGATSRWGRLRGQRTEAARGRRGRRGHPRPAALSNDRRRPGDRGQRRRGECGLHGPAFRPERKNRDRRLLRRRTGRRRPRPTTP